MPVNSERTFLLKNRSFLMNFVTIFIRRIFLIASFSLFLDISMIQGLKSSLCSKKPFSFRCFSSTKMETIVNLCKKKGFVFQSSEIYGSMAGFYDYGPLGVELKNNIKKLWWRDMVQRREDIFGIDCSIISSPLIWEASGHIGGFSDPMVDCKESKLRYRADQLFWAPIVTIDDKTIGYISLLESENMEKDAYNLALKRLKALGLKDKIKPLVLKDLTEASDDIYHLIPSPSTGNIGTLTKPRDFNLMFKTSVGAISDDSAVAYLRPETAQGIFTNFHSVQRSVRSKIPFGIAQIGKSFRNEITPRNFIFRSREFEQMEIEYFIGPDDNIWRNQHEEWIQTSWDWLKSIGLKEELMFKNVHDKSKLAHYAKACTDITFNFPFGVQELMGIAARGDYDLQQHSKHSGKILDYLDPTTNEKFVPHVIEPSLGVDRLFLALMTSAYREEALPNNESRVVLSFHPAVAPIKVNILPLLSNKPELTNYAKDLFKKLQRRYNCEFDLSGAIGRRYRRADEAGTPFCVTVDFDTLENHTVTLRERDSMTQIRMSIPELLQYLSKEIEGI